MRWCTSHSRVNMPMPRETTSPRMMRTPTPWMNPTRTMAGPDDGRRSTVDRAERMAEGVTEIDTMLGGMDRVSAHLTFDPQSHVCAQLVQACLGVEFIVAHRNDGCEVATCGLNVTHPLSEVASRIPHPRMPRHQPVRLQPRTLQNPQCAPQVAAISSHTSLHDHRLRQPVRGHRC